MRNHRRVGVQQIVVFVALAVALLVMTGCSSSLPKDPAGITGSITSVTAGDGGTVMLVDGDTQPAGAVSDRAQVTVPDGTPVFDGAGKSSSVDSLKLGATVRVWFEGPVAESYPVQGAASAVQVVTPAK